MLRLAELPRNGVCCALDTALPCVFVVDVRACVVLHGSLDIRCEGQDCMVARASRHHIHCSDTHAELPVLRHDFQSQSGE